MQTLSSFHYYHHFVHHHHFICAHHHHAIAESRQTFPESSFAFHHHFHYCGKTFAQNISIFAAHIYRHAGKHHHHFFIITASSFCVCRADIIIIIFSFLHHYHFIIFFTSFLLNITRQETLYHHHLRAFRHLQVIDYWLSFAVKHHHFFIDTRHHHDTSSLSFLQTRERTSIIIAHAREERETFAQRVRCGEVRVKKRVCRRVTASSLRLSSRENYRAHHGAEKSERLFIESRSESPSRWERVIIIIDANIDTKRERKYHMQKHFLYLSRERESRHFIIDIITTFIIIIILLSFSPLLLSMISTLLFSLSLLFSLLLSLWWL